MSLNAASTQFLKTSEGSRSGNCILEGWTLRGAHIDPVTTHCNAIGDVQWKHVWQGLPLLSLFPFGEATRHHPQPGESPQRWNLAPQSCYQCGSQGEVVCRTLSSSQCVSDEVAPGREGTSQVYDALGFGYSLVAAACPGVAACHPQAPAAALCSGKRPWQTAGCPY